VSAQRQVALDGMPYQVEVIHRRREPTTAPRLIMVCYNPTPAGATLSRMGVESIVRHTPGAYELWVVDNASPPEHNTWLRTLDGVNVVFNYTPPVPRRKWGWRAQLGLRRVQAHEQMNTGSYANAIGLELGVWAIDPDTQQVFVMHHDVLALRDNWLAFLQSKLSEHVRAAGTLRDLHSERIGALHISGLLFDFTLFRALDMSFLPDLPRLDAGDRISDTLRAHRYDEFVCRNTYNEPGLVDWIPESDPLHHLHADRAFDDQRQVIYAHLGRGIPKATGHYHTPGKTTADEWIAYAQEVVLA